MLAGWQVGLCAEFVGPQSLHRMHRKYNSNVSKAIAMDACWPRVRGRTCRGVDFKELYIQIGRMVD